MPMQIHNVPCNFVGEFKVGDNLVFNADMLCKLVGANDEGAFNKLVVLEAGSILEAALLQIIFRAQHHNREGVPNIPEADRRAIEGQTIDKFATVIDVMRRRRILDGLRLNIYDDLHNLRRYRNKIHIQDTIDIRGVSVDEVNAFSDQICTWALNLNLEVLQHLSANFARPAAIAGHVNDLSIPT